MLNQNTNFPSPLQSLKAILLLITLPTKNSFLAMPAILLRNNANLAIIIRIQKYTIDQLLLDIIAYNNFIGRMSQEPRSRSALQKPSQQVRNELRRRLDYVMEDNLSAKVEKAREGGHVKEWKMGRNVPLHLHPDIERVESVQKIGLVNYQSAIHELQDLIVPTKDDTRRQERRVKKHGRHGDGEYYETHGNPSHKAKDFMNKKSHKAERSVQYYKIENAELKTQLHLLKSKNQQAMIQIDKLTAKNQHLQKEIKHRQNRTEGSDSLRIQELEKELKHQLIINLELEEVMLKQKLDNENHGKQSYVQQQHIQETTILRNELANLQQAYTQLQQHLHQKTIEIDLLKQAVRLQSDKIIESPISSYPELQSPTFAALAFTPTKNQSTSPSLQNTTKNPQTTDSKPKDKASLPDNYLTLMFGHSTSSKTNAKTYRF